MGVVFSFRALLASGLVVVGLMTIGGRFQDPDLWFSLKLGEVVWNTHSVPTTDTFSYTANGQPRMSHEWLSELSIYAAYRAGGYTGLLLWFSGLASLLYVLVYVSCYRRCGNALGAFMGGLVAWFFGTVGVAIRPQLVGYSLLALEIVLLDLASKNRRWLWTLPPLFAIWVNCHASWIFGFAILCVYWICALVNGEWGLVKAEGTDKDTRRWLAATVILSGLALCINPVGIRLLLMPLTVTFRATSMNAVAEWLPPDLRDPRGWGLVVAVVGVLGVSLFRRSEWRLKELLVLAMGAALAMRHVRMLFPFGIVAAPVLCGVLASQPELRKRDHPAINGVLMLAFLAAIVWAFPSAAGVQQQIRRSNPAGAVEYIRRAGLSGPMLNEYVFGGYLMWTMPERKVFIDGRGDVYDLSGVMAEYGRWATLAEDPNLLLDKYRVRFCLLRKAAPMVQVMPYLPGWKKAYADDVAAVFVR